MAKLEYTLKNDMLFKLLFVKYPDLLKRLVAVLLDVRVESIREFTVRNPEMPPEVVGSKFCRLDINMTVDGQLVDLEIQVSDDGDYPERSLYYWAREYSSALGSGRSYSDLPRTIVVSITAFSLFDCVEFHSEFRPLEISRYTLLTDRMSLHYFELSKLPDVIDANDELKLWLSLFKAETEEELIEIEKMGRPIMVQAVKAYRHVSASEELVMLERMRADMRHNEASALAYAERKGIKVGIEQEFKKRQELEAKIAELEAKLREK